jgi:hypothetical protein
MAWISPDRSIASLALMYQYWYDLPMKPILDVRFFRTDTGTEPVREWLKDLSAIDRKTIGEDIKTVQFGWPLGMPKPDHDLAKDRLKLLRRR